MRWVVGTLLICAAILKTAQLLQEPAATLASPYGRLTLPTQAGVELALGMIVLSGACWRVARQLTILLFAAFAIYSMYLAMSGATSCGCFGNLRVHPWWTFLLDVTVVIGLIASIIADGAGDRSRADREEMQQSFLAPYRWKWIVFAIVLSGLTALQLVRHVNRSLAVGSNVTVTIGGLAVLDPERWIGQKLPIAEYIDANLSNGELIAVLYRHDCLECQKALPRYEKLASNGQQIALIELPPYQDPLPTESAFRNCRLKNDREWFAQTPVEIRLRDGIVTAVKVDAH